MDIFDTALGLHDKGSQFNPRHDIIITKRTEHDNIDNTFTQFMTPLYLTSHQSLTWTHRKHRRL